MPRTRAMALLVLSLIAVPSVRALELTLLAPVPDGGVAAASVGGLVSAAAGNGNLVLREQPRADVATIPGAVAQGQAALGAFPLALLEREHPVLAMDRVPYLASNYVDAGKLWQVLRPQVVEVLAARGLVLLYAIALPPPAPLSRNSLVTLDAWRGVRLLVDEPALASLARLVGAQPVTGGGAREVLAGGKADVALRPADAAVRDRAWEFAAHYVDARAWFPKMLVVANRTALERLDAASRKALLDAADAARREAWAASETATEQAVQRLRDYGIKATTPPVNLLIQLEAAGRELLFLWSDAAGETGAELVERYYAIR